MNHRHLLSHSPILSLVVLLLGVQAQAALAAAKCSQPPCSNPCSATSATLQIPSPVTISSSTQQGLIGTPGTATITFTCPNNALYSLGNGTPYATIQTNISTATSNSPLSTGQTLYDTNLNGIQVVLTPQSPASNGSPVPPAAPIGGGGLGNGQSALVTLYNTGGNNSQVTVTFTAQLYVSSTTPSVGTVASMPLITSFTNWTYGVTNSYGGSFGLLTLGTVTLKKSTCKGSSPNVVLPSVMSSALATAGTTTGRTPFTLSVTGCPSGTQLGITFNSTTAGSTTTVAQSSGSATNVGVQLLNTDAKTPIDITGTNKISLGAVPTSGAMNLAYYAQYYATGNATAGSVSAAVTYTLSYP